MTATTSTFLIRNTQGGRWLVVAPGGRPILAVDGYADAELAAGAIRAMALEQGRAAAIIRDEQGRARMVDVDDSPG